MQIHTFFDFCSGIGGGRLGLENCGLKCVGHSDTSRLSDSTYMQMFDTCQDKNYGNLKKLNKENLPYFDLLIAGFPCQTFSVIGRKAGFNDDRGQIIFHLVRILNEVRPKCFILENVKGLVTHDKGQTIRIIMKEFEKIGYHVSYRVITSLEHGVPQMRQRVYFVGFDKKAGLYGNGFNWILPEHKPELKDFLIDTGNEISEENLTKFRYYLKNPTNNGLYEPEDFLCEEYLIIDTRMSDLRLYRGRVPTLRSQRDGIYYIRDHKIRELTGYEALLLQGFPIEYANKVKSTVTNRHLLMQAGNAMTVNVIEKLGKSIIKHIQKGEFRMAGKEKDWTKFEVKATNYLNETFGDYSKFILEGGPNSTKPDILVKTNNGDSFYIEAKCNKAQSGQFVVLNKREQKKFMFSPRNRSSNNIYSMAIVDYINMYYDKYKNVGACGINIDIDIDIFSKWIINHYKNSNVKFMITSFNNNYTLFSIEKFKQYFYVKAVIRKKPSGSREAPMKDMDQILGFLKEEFGISKIYRQKGEKKSHIYVIAPEKFDEFKFEINGDFYQLNYISEEIGCEVKKLSKTKNPTVIFSIKSKKGQDPTEINIFNNELKGIK